MITARACAGQFPASYVWDPALQLASPWLARWEIRVGANSLIPCKGSIDMDPPLNHLGIPKYAGSYAGSQGAEILGI